MLLWRLLLRAAAALALAGIAAAEEGPLDEAPAPTSAPPVDAAAFLPAALSPRRLEARAFVSAGAGLDGARGGAVGYTDIEARLAGPVGVRAGASYDGPGSKAGPRFELRLDVATQAAAGADVALAAGYESVGFNIVPAATLRAAVGRALGPAYLLANVGYGQGLEQGERYGDLRLAALVPVTRAAQLGVDSRLQVDLERDAVEPAGEADWEWRNAAVASYAVDRLVFTVAAGVSALRLRASATTAVGPTVIGGIGTAF